MKSRFYILIVLLGLYFLPVFLAALTRRGKLKRFFWLNLALGWTGVGWIWLFASALEKDPAPEVEFLRNLDKIRSEHARKILSRLGDLRASTGIVQLVDRLGEQLYQVACCKAQIDELVGSKLSEHELSSERFTSTCDAAFKQVVLRSQYVSNQLATLARKPETSTVEVRRELQEIEQLVVQFLKFEQALSVLDVEDGTPLQPVEDVVRDLEDISSKAKRLKSR